MTTSAGFAVFRGKEKEYDRTVLKFYDVRCGSSICSLIDADYLVDITSLIELYPSSLLNYLHLIDGNGYWCDSIH